MAKRGVMCADCCYLDRTEKVQTGVMYKYGCRNHLAYMGHIAGWLSSDNGLKQMGCSEANKLHFGTIFSLKETKYIKPYRYIYLGRCGMERMLYNLTLKEYTIVEDNWIKERSIIIHGYHNLYVVYQYKDSYGLTGVENLLRMKTKESKTMIREGIIAVIRADGIKQARERKQKVIEKWENENLLPFS